MPQTTVVADVLAELHTRFSRETLYYAQERDALVNAAMALGTENRDILKLVARQGLQLVIVGLGVGLLSAWALSRTMASLSDPGALGTPRRPDGRFAV